MDTNPHILKAITLMGGQAEAARILKVKYQSIQSWRRQGAVAVKYCKAIEQAVHGKVKAKQLRPKDWQLYWADSAPSVVAAAMAGGREAAHA